MRSSARLRARRSRPLWRGLATPTRSSNSTRRPSPERMLDRSWWCEGRGAWRCRWRPRPACSPPPDQRSVPGAAICSSGPETGFATTRTPKGGSISSSSVRRRRDSRTTASAAVYAWEVQEDRGRAGRGGQQTRIDRHALRPAHSEARRLGPHRRAGGRRLDREHGREGVRRSQPARPAREPHRRSSFSAIDRAGSASAVFAGKGWGHGVGLCQVGAYGMAMRGADYKEILAHYYLGTSIDKSRPAAGPSRWRAVTGLLYSGPGRIEREELAGHGSNAGIGRVDLDSLHRRPLDRRCDGRDPQQHRRPLVALHACRAACWPWAGALLLRALRPVTNQLRQGALLRLRQSDGAGARVLSRPSRRRP